MNEYWPLIGQDRSRDLILAPDWLSLTSVPKMPWVLASSWLLVTGPGPGLVNLLPLFQVT